MTWRLTYDDGPALHTGDLLQYLDTVDLKAISSWLAPAPSPTQPFVIVSHTLSCTLVLAVVSQLG